MKEFPPDILEQLVLRHRPELKTPLSFSPIRTGHFNASFFVQAGRQEFVLRIAPPRDEVFVFYERDMMRQEPGIHALLLERTHVPVARVFAYDDSHDLIERDYLLMQRLPGRPLTDVTGADFDFVLLQMGRYLAQVHALTAESYGYLGAHLPMDPQPTWAEAFEIMWGKLIDDVAGVGHYDREESRLLKGLLGRHLRLFDRPVPSSLLHMDVWHQNILVDEDGRVTGVVDWDRTLWGDPEIEFAVLDYCGISEPAFWEGYGQRRDESPEARIRQVFYLLYELQKYIVIRQGRGRDAAGALRYKRQVMQIVSRLVPS